MSHSNIALPDGDSPTPRKDSNFKSTPGLTPVVVASPPSSPPITPSQNKSHNNQDMPAKTCSEVDLGPGKHHLRSPEDGKQIKRRKSHVDVDMFNSASEIDGDVQEDEKAFEGTAKAEEDTKAAEQKAAEERTAEEEEAEAYERLQDQIDDEVQQVASGAFVIPLTKSMPAPPLGPVEEWTPREQLRSARATLKNKKPMRFPFKMPSSILYLEKDATSQLVFLKVLLMENEIELAKLAVAAKFVKFLEDYEEKMFELRGVDPSFDLVGMVSKLRVVPDDGEGKHAQEIVSDLFPAATIKVKEVSVNTDAKGKVKSTTDWTETPSK